MVKEICSKGRISFVSLILFSVIILTLSVLSTGVKANTINVAEWSEPTVALADVNGRQAMIKVGDTYHMWYYESGDPEKLYHVSSSDPDSFTAATTANTFDGDTPVEVSSVTVWYEDDIFYMIAYETDANGGDQKFAIYTSDNGNDWTYKGTVFDGAAVSSLVTNFVKIDAPHLFKDDTKYRLYFQVKSEDGERYDIFTAESTESLASIANGDNDADFTLPSGKNPVLSPGATDDWDGKYVMHPMVVKDGGTYYMWYSAHNGDHDQHIGFASSADGYDWVKSPGNPVLRNTEPYYAYGEPSVIKDGASWRMWYQSVGANNGVSYLEATGPFEFLTIQDAIDAASDYDTINVAPGTYGPFKVIGKTDLTVQASDVVTVEGVQVVATNYGDRDAVVFVDDSTNIVLDGLTIGPNTGKTQQKDYGIIYENSGGHIKGCIVSPDTSGDMNSNAIAIWDDSEVTVEDCTIGEFGRIGVFIYNECTVDILGGSIKGQVYSGEDKVCYGVEVEYQSVVTIDGVEIYNCDNTFDPEPSWESSAVLINGWLQKQAQADSTVSIINSDIHDNYIGVIAVKSPSSSAHSSNIHDNRIYGAESMAAHDDSTAVFDATKNWWGDSTGPTHEDNLFGAGDTVTENVDYEPWCANARCSAFGEEDDATGISNVLRFIWGLIFSTDEGCDGDSDGDGLSDADELNEGTDPNNPDTDGDGFPDGTDNHPTNPDANDNGILDGEEGYNPS